MSGSFGVPGCGTPFLLYFGSGSQQIGEGVQNSLDEDVLKSFDIFAVNLMEKYQLPDAAVGVARDGQLTYYRGFGTGATMDTVFGIGSITKSFTAVAIMQLQERGHLRVKDPVNKYLPAFRLTCQTDASAVTIHHFLTHTAGLPPLPCLLGAMKASMLDDPGVRENEELLKIVEQASLITNYEELIESIAHNGVPPLGKPGAQFSYSNDAYALLGAMIEVVSGLPYETYIEQNILQPAGMSSSRFDTNFGPGMDVATLYATRKQGGGEEVYRAPAWWSSPAMLAAGSLKSTVSDMLRYAEVYRTSGTVEGVQILSAASVREMIHPYVEAEPGRYYGYGLMITPDYHGATLIDHGGSLKGVQAQMCVVPERGLTSIALTNLQGAPASKLGMGALQCELGAEPGAPIWAYQRLGFEDPSGSAETTVGAAPEADLARYVGKYVSGEGGTVEFSLAVNDDSNAGSGEGSGVTPGQLIITLSGKSYDLVAMEDHVFVFEMKSNQNPVRFFVNEEGIPTAISYHFRMIPRQS